MHLRGLFFQPDFKCYQHVLPCVYVAQYENAEAIDFLDLVRIQNPNVVRIIEESISTWHMEVIIILSSKMLTW